MSPTGSAPVDGPNINLLSLRADVYRLLCLLVADETVNAVELFREASHQVHEEEVNRLLIWIAVATRQLFDLDSGDEDLRCGRLWRRYPSDDTEPLTFRKACDKIIHASEIVAYPLPEDSDADDGDVRSTTRRYAGTITVRTRATRRHPASRAELDFEAFAEHCFRMTAKLAEEH